MQSAHNVGSWLSGNIVGGRRVIDVDMCNEMLRLARLVKDKSECAQGDNKVMKVTAGAGAAREQLARPDREALTSQDTCKNTWILMEQTPSPILHGLPVGW